MFFMRHKGHRTSDGCQTSVDLFILIFLSHLMYFFSLVSLQLQSVCGL